jgi:SAM-dependent methyltransferase
MVKTLENIRREEASDWERNAEFYRTDDHSPLMQSLARRREQFYEISAGQRVLDLGCGSGAVVASLRRRGVDAVGVDYAQAMVDVARTEYGLGEQVRRSDAADLPFETNSFDVVIANGVFHHLAVQEELLPALREVRRVLKPGGRLCCFDRNGSWVSTLMSGGCVRIKELLRIATGRQRFASCASRNEIGFGDPDDLKTIGEFDFDIIRQQQVSTALFFFCVVVLNGIEYFLSSRLRSFIECRLVGAITWIDRRCGWRQFCVEQFIVFNAAKCARKVVASAGRQAALMEKATAPQTQVGETVYE